MTASPAGPEVEAVVLLRPGCHLCTDALAALERLRPHLPDGVALRVRPVDVEADEDLLRRYLERIPVVVVEGEEAGDFFVDPDRVLAAVGRALHRRGAGRGGGADSDAAAHRRRPAPADGGGSTGGDGEDPGDGRRLP